MEGENNFLNSLSNKNVVDNNPIKKTEIINSLDKEVLDNNSFNDFRVSNGFVDGRRGTFFSKDKNQFLYIKNCFELKSEKQAKDSIKVLKYLTNLGIFQPDTEFEIYSNENEGYQIVPIMHKLEEWDLDKNGKDGRQIVLDTGRAETSKNLLSDKSHIKEWLQRIPGNENVSTEILPDNLANLLNVFEASERTNWGWDTDGKLYPVDVEVISLNNDYSQTIIDKWLQING